MATATKNARVLLASTTLVPGGTATGAGLSLLNALGGLATLVVTNGAAGPNAGCEPIVEISRNGSDWHEYTRQRAGTTASTTYAFHVEVPPGVMHVRSSFTGNTSQNVTVEAFFQELSEVG